MTPLNLNPYLSIHVEVLHQNNIGIIKMLMDILRQLVSPHVLQAFDDKSMVIKETCQYPNF